MRLGLGLGVKNSTFVGGYDPAAAAFLAATGITSKTESDAINDLVVRLKGYGLWSKMKAIYPFVSDQKNLSSYTEDFNSIGWQKSGNTVTVDTTTAPDGTLTADTVNSTSAGANYLAQPINVSASTQYTFSFYAIKGTNTTPKYRVYNNTGGADIVAETSYGSLINSSTWTRVSVTFTTPVGCTSLSIYLMANGGIGTTFLWGAQLELGSSMTSYQKTTATASSVFVQQFKYNLKDPRDLDAAFRLAFSGTWAYSKLGATPNGVNAFADTKLNPTTVGFTQTDTHISAYLRTDSNGSKVDIGGSYNLFMGARWANNYNYPINRSNNANGTSADSIGYFLASRVDNVRDRMFKNGTNVTNFNTAAVSLDNNSIIISATNGGGLYSDRQTAFNTIGNGLTDQDAANLYTSIQIYQQDLSRAVGTPIAKVSDLSAQSYVAATQIQNTVYASAVNTFVKGMKAVGLWEKMKAVYPFVSDNVNQFGYTEDFTFNGMWSQNRCTMAANVTTAPDGTMTADSFTTISTTIECQLRASISSPYNNVTQTTSVYAKKSTANFFRIRNLSSGGNAWFNLTNGTIGTIQGGQTATMTSVGNGWYRCTLTGTKGVSATDLYDIGFTDADGTSWPSASVVGFLWGAQLQLGSTATTYIPVASTVDNKFVQQFKYNLMSPLDADGANRLSFNGSWSYSLLGATPNGVNGYANTYFNPVLNGLTTSNSHLSYYARTAATTSDPAEIANFTNNNEAFVLQSKSSVGTNRFFYTLGSAASRVVATAPTGFMSGSAISNTRRDLYLNGVSVANNTTTDNASLGNYNLYLAAGNIGGASTASYSNSQTAFASIGNGLTSAEMANYYTLVQGLQINLNRQV